MPSKFWEDDRWVSRKEATTAEHYQWLVDHRIGSEKHVWYEFVKCCAPNGNHEFHYHFADAGMAMLFKLTFAGVGNVRRSGQELP